ncbi:16S rRNA (adenine(1518)-N(6)/adenine(1519)-N(6))-dimethyltransferase RsmA [Neoactinobaculum massilliense]|uniref:16S rRNA (adenine(1518)-N(6)/adenine(1519)-N(6))- dimethyltransferase RsmA n=1 Tax=Neoactinobaculum massilliense TaxID=2364794 RepID=UPI000F53AEEC|nr:16S rRNA (adenine(1518)-N(6)/adenine(1519)-N(6))-dimethyltransferase RsmA [Neoactinobaculum massilliense]
MRLLTPTDIREIAAALGLRPTKQRGQNFVGDAGTVRRIVAEAGVTGADRVVEVGPGLGSLTLALLETGASVSAIELDPLLAAALPATVAARADEPGRLAVRQADAMSITGPEDLAVPVALAGAVFEPTKLVSNLPYNVAVPVLLTLLEALPSLELAVVMVQLEVADRLAATPGSKVYGAPSVKAQWYANVRRGPKVGRTVFWPVPNVDSALVVLERRQPPAGPSREEVFSVIDAAFAQRRKTLRSALGRWAGSPARAEHLLEAAGISPQARGETLAIDDFVRIAAAANSAADLN